MPLDLPPWLIALLACGLLLLPVLRFTWGLTAVLAASLWADSSMRFGAELVRDARLVLLPLLVVQGAVRLRREGVGARVPAGAVAYALLATATLAWTADVKYAGLNLVLLWVLGVVAFAYVPRLVRGPEDAHRVARLFVGVALAAIVVGFVPPLRDGPLFVEGRLRGFFANANGLGITCALVAPWVLTDALAHHGTARGRRVLVVGALAALAFLSGSRTGFGGLMVAVGTVLWLRNAGKFVLSLMFLGAVVSLLSLVDSGDGIEEATEGVVRTESLARASGRLRLWAHGLGLWREAPVFGHGYLAGFSGPADRGGGVERRDVLHDTSHGSNFHSLPVETLVDLGVVGLACVGMLLVSLVRRARTLARHVDPSTAAFGGAMLADVFVVLLDGFFHNWLLRGGSPYGLLFWPLVAVGLRLARPVRPAGAPAFAVGSRTPSVGAVA